VTALAFFPELRPSTSQDIVFKNVKIDRNVAFAHYIKRHVVQSLIAKNRIALSAHQPAPTAPGAVVNFEVDSHRFRKKALPLRWSVYSAADNQLVEESEGLDPLGSLILTPGKKGKDVTTFESWIDTTRCRQACYVRLEIYDHDGNRVAYTDSANFTRSA
jgi:hypothetical protein